MTLDEAKAIAARKVEASDADRLRAHAVILAAGNWTRMGREIAIQQALSCLLSATAKRWDDEDAKGAARSDTRR